MSVTLPAPPDAIAAASTPATSRRPATDPLRVSRPPVPQRRRRSAARRSPPSSGPVRAAKFVAAVFVGAFNPVAARLLWHTDDDWVN